MRESRDYLFFAFFFAGFLAAFFFAAFFAATVAFVIVVSPDDRLSQPARHNGSKDAINA